MAEEIKGGEISAWNEGDYKNLRLHKAQQIINIASASPLIPLKRFSNSNESDYGYVFWFQGINMLFREGKSKYSKEEFGEVKELKAEIEKFIANNKICFEIKNRGDKQGNVFWYNWYKLKALLEEYEDKVYYYNDVHGFSTRNIEEDEGL